MGQCKTYTRHNPEAWGPRVTVTLRTAPGVLGLASLADAAPWLARFTPPYAFGDFFAPEDTVLCVLATRAALARPPGGTRLAELTAGGALVLADALLDDPARRGAAAELDPAAVRRARANLAGLGLGGRSVVQRSGLFSRGLSRRLRRFRPDVVACNPPYIPEPPGNRLALVAGAGADGARHPRRAIHTAARAGVPRLVLSWCSVGDPVGVVDTAAHAGYQLTALWCALIADGEYTGAVHGYLRTLPTAFLTEDGATLDALAPDGAAHFAYLLLAGEFQRTAGPTQRRRRAGERAAGVVDGLVHDFARDGAAALAARAGGAPASVLDGVACQWFAADRWDELRMRALAHGPVTA
ncbi:hypothetical protein tb265_21700 [Gemmatimonadetes bacterium T265]|nr:hypothetical protein tb265_21700 [Gemmatimonadetes bacterium T265]